MRHTPSARSQSQPQDLRPSRSPFIGAGVVSTEAAVRERPLTAGKPAGVWNGGGRLPEGKRHLAERKHLPGCVVSSTVAGQRQQRDELTVETARPLPAGWAKLRSRSMPSRAYYHDACSGQSQWQRPSRSRAGRGIAGQFDDYDYLRRSSSATSSSRRTMTSTCVSVSPTASRRSSVSSVNCAAPSSRPRSSRSADGATSGTDDPSMRKTRSHVINGRLGGVPARHVCVDPAVVAIQRQATAGGGSRTGLQLS